MKCSYCVKIFVKQYYATAVMFNLEYNFL